MSEWIIGAVIIILLAALVYWQVILAEGVYLGRRVVIALYDLGAASYDRVKGFDPDDETDYLGRPLADRLSEWPDALVLDVATGTGRLPLALLAQPHFTGAVIALDASRRMLDQAAQKLAGGLDRVTLLHHDAAPLPFPDAHFHAVTCLEALEFLPDPHAALREMVRVLRPGGVLFLSNRVGLDRLFFPGRSAGRHAFEQRLAALGLIDIRTEVWQTYYDLVWAVKRPNTDFRRS